MRKLPVSLQALLIQLLVLPGSLLLAWLMPALPGGWLGAAIIQGVLAGTLSYMLGLPFWWWLIQLLFWPLLVIGIQQPQLQSAAPFILLGLFLLFSNVLRDRVPFFLSSSKIEDCLSRLLEGQFGGAPRVIDLGCGSGGLVNHLQRSLPAAQVEGIESAIVPWLLAKVRSLLSGGKVRVYFGDFWKLDLGSYDVVYAYLSPEPMPRLWQKVVNEMKPGSLFISNTFAVPDIEPDTRTSVPDWNGSTLHIWRIGHA